MTRRQHRLVIPLYRHKVYIIEISVRSFQRPLSLPVQLEVTEDTFLHMRDSQRSRMRA